MVDGQELFDGEEVVSWLETTGCGNNPQARDDAIAFTLAVVDVSTDTTVFAGLTALICLRAAIGPLPADPEDLLDAAESFDSDDELLFAEVEGLESRLEPLARYAELLVANAFDAADPFDELVLRQQERARRPPMRPMLSSLVGRTALALADEAGFSEPTCVVRTVDDIGLVVGAAAQAEERGAMKVAVTWTDEQWRSAGARLGRRWLQVHRVTPIQISVDSDGAYELPDQSVVVLRLPTASGNRAADLDQVSNLCLNLSPRNRAVVVGPSASLTDSLMESRGLGGPAVEGSGLSPAGLVRSDALRTGMVRAVVRLPQGLLPEQIRARAGLWCLGPSRSTPSSILCADLSGPLDPRASDDLITDLSAAMQGPQAEVAHQLSRAHFRPTSDLILASRGLVTPTVREVQLNSALVVTNLVDVLSRAATDVPGIRRPELTATADATAVPRLSLEEAVRARKIILIPGARIEPAVTSADVDVPVLRHPEDLGRRAQLPGLNVLALHTAYPHVTLTEPGDVVATTVGGPAAAVDHLGGAVVAYPARVLRCHRPREASMEERAALIARGLHPPDLAKQTFIPEAIVADITAQPPGATNWKAWPLTVLPVEQIPSLERTLAELAERRTRLDAARADVDAAIRTLTQAVGAQICTVSTTGLTPTEERNAR